MSNKRYVQQQFGKNADSYVTSKIHKAGEDLQKLLKMASITGQEEVLDIATGGGHTANEFAPFVKKITALDITPQMLRAAEIYIKGNGHKNVEFVQEDAEQLPFADESFDIVTCRIAAHHFPNVQKFIAESYRVLKCNGQLLFIDNTAPEENALDQFYNEIEKKRDMSHYRAWKKSEWIIMLEIAGFKVTEWHRFEKTFLFDSWCNRMRISQSEKSDLNDFILNASQKVKEKFHIVINDQSVSSFQGESMILKALKS